MLARWWHATIAVLVFGAVALQIAIAVRVSGLSFAGFEITDGLQRLADGSG